MSQTVLPPSLGQGEMPASIAPPAKKWWHEALVFLFVAAYLLVALALLVLVGGLVTAGSMATFRMVGWPPKLLVVPLIVYVCGIVAAAVVVVSLVLYVWAVAGGVATFIKHRKPAMRMRGEQRAAPHAAKSQE